jgi:hypothetical protein
MKRRVVGLTACLVLVIGFASHASAVPVEAGVAARAAVARIPSRVPYGTLAPAASRLRPETASSDVPTRAAPRFASPLSQVAGFRSLRTVQPLSPADPTGAVGNNFVLTAINTEWELWDKSGFTTAAGKASLKTLFPSVRMSLFDPKIVYDPYLFPVGGVPEGGYVLVFLGYKGSTRRSRIFTVAIPDDPTAGRHVSNWCRRQVPGDQYPGNGAQWSDYPGVGFDRNRVWISTNLFGFAPKGGFFGAQVLGFRNATIDCRGSSTAPFRMYGATTAYQDGHKALTIQPAVTVGNGPGPRTTEYMLSFEWGCSSTCSGAKLGLWSVDDAGGTPTVSKRSISTTRDTLPDYGTQSNTYGINNRNYWWDTGDLRLINAWYDSSTGHVYAAHAVSDDINPGDGYTESVIHWFDVNPTAGTIARDGLVGTEYTDAGWPAVGTDSNGNLYITYSRAGDEPGYKEYLSAWVATVPPASTTVDAQLRLSPGAGASTYNFMLPSYGNYGIERWGDFDAISRDPADPTKMWIVNQCTPVSSTGVTSRFQEVVGEVAHP